MPEFTSYAPGTPSWVDIGSPDVAKAAAFYGRLFGWEATDQGADGFGYHMFQLRGKPVAGLGPQQNPGPPYWSTYVSVEDADRTAKAIEAAGGTVLLAPMDILDAGRMAVFMDTTGVPVSIWQPQAHIGAAVANEAGAFGWTELNTRDTATAAAFYEAAFGWKAEASEAPMPYTEFKLDGKSVAGMVDMAGRVPDDVPAHWLVYFGTADVDATAATATEAGGQVFVGPMDIPIGRLAVLGDPDGAVFALFQMPGA